MKVVFWNVGRYKHEWAAELPNMDETTITRHVRRQKVLMSNDIKVELDSNQTGGTIYAGYRAVGKFRQAKE